MTKPAPKRAPSTRKVEKRIEIEAPPELVWKALTDPTELTRWFPLEARVQPGAGGSIHLSWGPPWEGSSRIEEWEPGRRLRTVAAPPEGQTTWLAPDEEGPDGQAGLVTIALDYELEGRGGRTVLRLVHSGFLDSADWDDEYEGVRRGWDYELMSLREYLERHRGQDRRVARATRRVGLPAEETWRRLAGPEGIVRGGLANVSGPGARCTLETFTGERLDLSIRIWDPPSQLAGVAENLGGAMFRIGVEKMPGRVDAWVWLAAWDRPASELVRMERHWIGRLEELFPETV